MAAIRFIGFAGLLSLANAQKTIDLPSFCALPPVVATASILAQYTPALSYCSKNFPGATSPITLVQSAGPELINVVTSTIGFTTDAFTTTTLIATAVVIVTPSSPITATETVTVGAGATSTLFALNNGSVKRSYGNSEPCEESESGNGYTGQDTTESYGSPHGESPNYNNSPQQHGNAGFQGSQYNQPPAYGGASPDTSNYGHNSPFYGNGPQQGGYNGQSDPSYDSEESYTHNAPYSSENLPWNTFSTVYTSKNSPDTLSTDTSTTDTSTTETSTTDTLTTDTLTTDTSTTAAPTSTLSLDPADVFSSLQLLDAALIGPVCTCIEAPDVIVTISALPVGTNTEWLMTTVTVFTTAVPQLIATVSVATTETTTAAETTTVTVTLPDATVVCTAPASANLLVDGGFDINPSVNWQVDAPANPVDGTGEATTWEFLRGQEGAGAISGPNLASSTLEDLVSLQHLLSQSVTGIDTSAQYTLSFWYRAFLVTTNPPPNRLEGDPVDGSTICRLRVYWGDQLLFNQGFNEETGSGQPWRNIVLQNIVQPLDTADLLFRHSCVPREDLDGYNVLYLDSVALVPQVDVTCSGV